MIDRSARSLRLSDAAQSRTGCNEVDPGIAIQAPKCGPHPSGTQRIARLGFIAQDTVCHWRDVGRILTAWSRSHAPVIAERGLVRCAGVEEHH